MFKVKDIIKLVILLLMLSMVIVRLMFIANAEKKEASAWNNGICPLCDSKFDYIYTTKDDMDIYKCENGHQLKLEKEALVGFTEHEKKWNHGQCRKCKTKWHFKEKNQSFLKERYIFECEKGHVIELKKLPE